MTGPSSHPPAADSGISAPAADDPILVKRARMSRLASTGIRVGLGLFAVASLLFFWSVATEFTPAVATATAACLLIGSAVLAPAMVLKYTVKAADRADRDGSW